MLLSKVIKLYADARTVDGFAAATVRNNESDLRKVLAITGDMDIKRLNARHIDQVFQRLAERGMANTTMNQIQGTLSGFCRWCRERGFMDQNQNPVGSRRYRPIPQKEKNIVPASQFGALLDAAGQGEMGGRDRAFIAAGLYTMCRSSEIRAIKVGDVNFTHKEIDVTIFKTKERDVLPMVQEFEEELLRWMNVYRSQLSVHRLEDDWYLFPAYACVGYHQWAPSPKRPISRTEDIVHRALRGIGWSDDRMGVHVLRRSAATARVEENMAMGHDGAIRDVQTWLHHKSVTTTEIYLSKRLDRDRRDKRAKGQPMFPSLRSQNPDRVTRIQPKEETG